MNRYVFVLSFAVVSLGASAAYKAAYDVNNVPAIGQNAADMRGDRQSGHPRILILGNSITRHGPRPQIGWTNDFGMAASSIDKDFAHVLAAKIKARFPTAGFALSNVAGTFERTFQKGLALERDFGWMRAWQPDAVILFFGANCPKTYDAKPDGSFGRALEELRGYLSNGKTKFLVSEGFYRRPVLEAEKQALAARCGDTFVAMDDVRSRDDVRGRFGHPSDHGMRLIAERFWSYLEPALSADAAEPLADFWRAADGKTVRRLPVGVVPENVFLSFGTRDFADGMKTFNRLLDESLARSTYNCITLTLRCNPELGDPETRAAAKACFERAHREGVKVYMDTDPRIARAEFFTRHPDENQSIAKVAAFVPTNGAATFSIVFDPVQDHMSWGSRNAYRPLSGKVASAFAVRRRADGALDFAARRPVKVSATAPVSRWGGSRDAVRGDARDCETEFSRVTVTGSAAGLAADETLVVTAQAEYFSIDVFSPNLLPFARGLMERYRALGADGGMRDEWGFIPNFNPDLKTFFYSPHFAAALKRDYGRDLLADLPLMALGAAGDPARSAAIGAYMKAVLARNAEIERDFYATDKRLFGRDVYVCKHPTWYSSICPQEFFHNGLDWWQAPRDWAQGDETTPIYALNALAKKCGGPVWMNEGYTPTPEMNVFRVWTYALTGGRQVYHGLYGNAKQMARYQTMSWEERRLHTGLDLLAVGNVTAQSRIRLQNLITRAQVDAPVAFLFGHEALVDFSDPGWNDHGRVPLFELFSHGWWADAYPASECALGTFKVDAEGYLRVGRQRYAALATHNLRPSEKATLNAILKGHDLKTRIFNSRDTQAIENYLAQIGATRQPCVKDSTKAGPFYPEPDGTLHLTDGTTVRVRADWDHPRGLAIDETIVSHGVSVFVAAEGLAAVRVENGRVVALTAGGLRKVEGPGIKLALDRPEDVALVLIDSVWHGVWQTAHPERPVPAALADLAKHWIKLQLPAHLAAE